MWEQRNESPMGRLLRRVLSGAAGAIDRGVGWDRLPVPLGLVTLIGLRERLRERNLYDPIARGVSTPGDAAPLARTIDGSGNDPADPKMGMVGQVFGRNVPIEESWPEPDERLLSPSPREVSRTLMARREFIPADTLNVLAAAWIQFQIRDWFRHGDPRNEDPWRLDLSPEDDWPQDPMLISRTAMDGPAVEGAPPTFINHETHWWDASQLYGSTPEFERMLRSGADGKVRLDERGLLPIDPAQLSEFPGGIDGWWAGLALLHVLFMREHNAICDRLRSEYPGWSDDELFDHARLINAALIAKIHTVEWTPGILGHPTLQIGMRANWWGLAGERLHDLVDRYTDSDLAVGIPGSATDHHAVPYAITEEFVAVYRMHPLVPDDYRLRQIADDQVTRECSFDDIAEANTHALFADHGFADLLYSFGVAHPGAITLRNYPNSLRQLALHDGTLIDLAAIDVLRTRERGVPRYNRFRQLLHLSPCGSFEELTDDPKLREDLRRLYDDDIDRVDTVVGMYAEQPPRGFGFSDTAFRIFVLMASRRLKSDRFFTTDFRPEVYTQAGMDWIAANDMRTVLLRHAPELEPALRGVDNAFAPWNRTIVRATRR
jgi:hypothetical protein